MKNSKLLFFLLLCIALGRCKNTIEADAFEAYTYASWRKVAEIGSGGKEIAVEDTNQFFVRTWSGWTLSQPPKGLDSVFFQSGNNTLFKDRVEKIEKMGESGRFLLYTDKGKRIEIKFDLPSNVSNNAYLYVSHFQNGSISNNRLDKYTFVKSTE